jgi:hypothetical protein
MPAADLRNVVDEVTILESREIGHDAFEICASVSATLDESTRELRVELESFVRQIIHAGKDLVLHPPWLPKPDSVKTHVSFEDAPEAVQEIAQNWRARVRKSIPPPSQWVKDAPWLRKSMKQIEPEKAL